MSDETTKSTLSEDVIARLPKVVLHDHLDGGLRPATILELAAGSGHELPADTIDGLADWFADSADSDSESDAARDQRLAHAHLRTTGMRRRIQMRRPPGPHSAPPPRPRGRRAR